LQNNGIQQSNDILMMMMAINKWQEWCFMMIRMAFENNKDGI